MPPTTRINWEFYAVLQGRCGPLFPGEKASRLMETTLWIFPPENAHGWTGEQKRCWVAAFHYGSVPHPLDSAVRRKGYVAVGLTPRDVTTVRRIAAELRPHYSAPTWISPIVWRKGRLELSLLVLEKMQPDKLVTLPTSAQVKVENALNYYREHLNEHPSVEKVAQEVHVSPSHLRRLFMQVREESPQHAFSKIVMEEAMEIMSNTTVSLEEVASECGFSGASEFCRAFKRQFHVPPSVWRKGILPPYMEPRYEKAGVRRAQERSVLKKVGKYTSDFGEGPS